jgi:predicted acylesterase/phospholipase RssA
VQSDQHREELRIAVVMNGGVSLAVWMGGVTRELDRVRRSDSPYGQMLDLTNTEARIDVIAGASAGGINGAVLALAIARGTNVDGIRELWMTNGDIGRLLRDPFQRDAPSVLKGDEALLAALRNAMKNIGGNESQADPSETRPPLHLSITGTLLKGELKTYPDLFGQMVPDVTHHALFRFRRPGVPQDGDPWPDNYARTSDGQDQPAERLALAARSSASFPGAFEPSFVPIGASANDTHPDMAGIADFSSERWVIDGGVLVNTPFRPALDAIKTLPAERPVRRVLGYVVPNPKGPTQPDNGVPSAGEVVFDAVSRLPRVQSVGRELTEIEENNRNVRRRRDARDHLLAELDAEQLKATARLLLPAYVATRTTSAAEDILQALVVATGSSEFPTAAQVAELRRVLRGVTDAPWLPPAGAPDTFDEVPIEPWQWGFAPVENAANVSLEILRRMVRAPAVGATRHVRMLRQRTHLALRKLREIHQESNAYWQTAAASIFQQGNQTVDGLVSGWGVFQGPLLELAREFAAVVTEASVELSDSNTEEEATLLWQMLRSLAGETAEATLRALLALDVIQRTSCGDLGGIDQEVELVLMSGDAENAFGLTPRAEDKLAGLQVGHFGAFYKSSWRANDWTWGRLDGADRLVRTLLDPRRIQKRVQSEGVDTVAATLLDIASESSNPKVAAWLATKRGEIQPKFVAELKALRELPTDPPLTALPDCYAAIRRRVQVEIIADEVPKIASAVANDRKAHAARDSLGSLWEHTYPAGTPLGVEETVTAFTQCPVAEERVAGELGSDRFTKVSTTAAAVAGSVLGGALPRLKILRPGFTMIRGLLLALYLLARGATESGKTGSFLVALTLALGGALVAIYAIGTHVPGLLLLLGSVVLAAGILLAMLRTARSQILLAVAIFVGSIAAYYGVREWHERPTWVDPFAAILAVVLAAIAATMLGRSHRQTPAAKDEA